MSDGWADSTQADDAVDWGASTNAAPVDDDTDWSKPTSSRRTQFEDDLQFSGSVDDIEAVNLAAADTTATTFLPAAGNFTQWVARSDSDAGSDNGINPSPTEDEQPGDEQPGQAPEVIETTPGDPDVDPSPTEDEQPGDEQPVQAPEVIETTPGDPDVDPSPTEDEQPGDEQLDQTPEVIETAPDHPQIDPDPVEDEFFDAPEDQPSEVVETALGHPEIGSTPAEDEQPGDEQPGQAAEVIETTPGSPDVDPSPADVEQPRDEQLDQTPEVIETTPGSPDVDPGPTDDEQPRDEQPDAVSDRPPVDDGWGTTPAESDHPSTDQGWGTTTQADEDWGTTAPASVPPVFKPPEPSDRHLPIGSLDDSNFGVHPPVTDEAQTWLSSHLIDDSGLRRTQHESASVNAVLFVDGMPLASHLPPYLSNLGNVRANGARSTVSFKFGQFTPPVLVVEHSYFHNNKLYRHAFTHLQLEKITSCPTKMQLDMAAARDSFPIQGYPDCSAYRIAFAIDSRSVRHIIHYHTRQVMRDAGCFPYRPGDPARVETQNAYERRLDTSFTTNGTLAIDLWISADATLLHNFCEGIKRQWVRAREGTLRPLFAPSPWKHVIDLGNFVTPDRLNPIAPEPKVIFFQSLEHAHAARLYYTLYEHLYDVLLANEFNSKTSEVFLLPVDNTLVNGKPSEFILAVHATDIPRDLVPRVGDNLDVQFAGGYTLAPLPENITGYQKGLRILSYLMKAINDSYKFYTHGDDIEEDRYMHCCDRLRDICPDTNGNAAVWADAGDCLVRRSTEVNDESGNDLEIVQPPAKRIVESAEDHKARVWEFVQKHLESLGLPPIDTRADMLCRATVIDKPQDMAALGSFFLRVTIRRHPYWPKDLPKRPLVNFVTPYPNLKDSPSIAGFVNEYLQAPDKWKTEVRLKRTIQDGPTKAHIFAATEFSRDTDTRFGRFAKWTLSFDQSGDMHHVADAFPMYGAIVKAMAVRYGALDASNELCAMASALFGEDNSEPRLEILPKPPSNVDHRLFHALWKEIEALDADQRQGVVDLSSALFGYKALVGLPGAGKTRELYVMAALMQAERIDADSLLQHVAEPADPRDDEITDKDTEINLTERTEKNFDYYFSDASITAARQARARDKDDDTPWFKTKAPKGAKFADDPPLDTNKTAGTAEVPKPKRRRPKIYFVATENVQADDIARDYLKVTRRVGLKVAVIRLMGWDREKALVQSTDKPFEGEFDEPDKVLDYMETNIRIREIRERARAAQNVQQTGGLLRASDAAWALLLAKVKDFAKVHELQFTDIEQFDQHRKEYNAWIDDALRAVVASAHVIVGTSYAAYKLHNCNVFYPDIIIHDEVARATESETLTAWASFPDAFVRIVAGDPRQSTPFSLSADAHLTRDAKDLFINPFGNQGKLSFMERSMLANASSNWLCINHRTRFGLANFSSEKFYNNRMVQANIQPATAEEQRTLNWLRDLKSGMRGARLWADVFGKTELKDVSTQNLANVNFVLDLVEKMQRAMLSVDGQLLDIGIVTPYGDQLNLYVAKIAQRSDLEICKEAIEVRTSRGAQGWERRCIIFDTTRSESPGFLAQVLNVCLTRSSLCEFVIGNSRIFGKKHAANPAIRNLLALYQDCQEAGAVLEVDGEVFLHQCPICFAYHEKGQHQHVLCRYCPVGSNRHHTRSCPHKRLHTPMSRTVVDPTPLPDDVSSDAYDPKVARGKKAIRDKTRADYYQPPDGDHKSDDQPAKDQPAEDQHAGDQPAEDQQPTDDDAAGPSTTVRHEHRFQTLMDLRNRTAYDNAVRPTPYPTPTMPTVSEAAPQGPAPTPASDPLREDVFVWSDLAHADAIGEDFDAAGRPVRLDAALGNSYDALRGYRKIRHDRLQQELFQKDKDARFRSGARGLQARKALTAIEKKVAEFQSQYEQKDEDISPEDLAKETSEAADMLADLQLQVEPSKLAEVEARAKKILTGLGFSDQYMQRLVSSLSGGWKMRTSLAAALLQETDILILDEPTNFLDLLGIIWLQRHLTSLAESTDPPTLILVSHDRDFISLCTDLLIIKDKDLMYFHGDLPTYEAAQAEKKVYLTRMKEAQDKQKGHIQQTIQRNMREGKAKDDQNKIRQAKSRQKKLDDRWGLEINAKGGRFKLNKDMAGWYHTSRAEIDVPQDQRPINFLLPPPPDLRFPGALLSLERMSFRYPRDPKITNRTTSLPPLVLKDIILSVNEGDRIAILGLNGSGKSTLIKLLVGAEGARPTSGTLTTHPRLRLGYYSQHAVEALQRAGRAEPDLTALTLLARESSSTTSASVADDVDGTRTGEDEGALRAILGSLGLPGRLASDVPVSKLSGGQLVRLELARILRRRPQLLVLDEPTTHLDYETVAALRRALRRWPGAVVLVSHDRWFVRGVVEGSSSVPDDDGHGEGSSDESEEEDEAGTRTLRLCAVYRLRGGHLTRLEGGVEEFVKGVLKRVPN